MGLIAGAIAVSAGGIAWNALAGSSTELVQVDSAQSEIAAVDVPAVIVHVSGQVRAPGIVELPDGARVIDAIEASGGLSQSAQVDGVNLARRVVDGEHLVVPAEGESPVRAEATDGALSLSLADEQTLQQLPGVGPAIAARIVAWREENGPFRHVEDVLAVSGIGPATLDKFRDRVVP